MSDPDHTRRPRLTLSSPGRALAAGLGLLALVAIVAAVGRAHHTPGGHAGGHAPPAAVGDYLFSILAVFVFAAMLTILYVLLSQPGLLPERRSRKRNALLVLLAFALFATLFGQAHGVFRGLTSPNAQRPPVRVRPPPRPYANRSAPERPPRLQWLPVLVGAAGAFAVFAVVGARAIRRNRQGLIEELRLEQRFEQLVEETLADLYAETDPRRAIIKAYARVERLFASCGFARRRAEAPLEYLARVLPEVHASGSALRRLTALFQWAKFSTHDVDAPMRDEAIHALVEVRDELRANRAGVAA